MSVAADRLIGAMVTPLLVLAAIGGLLSMCNGQTKCPVDPVSGREICNRWSDAAAHLRAERYEGLRASGYSTAEALRGVLALEDYERTELAPTPTF